MSDPTEPHGTECVYCGQDHPKRHGCPIPDFPYRTEAQLRRDAGYLAAADALLADPANLAAFTASMASLSATARHTAGDLDLGRVPGPA